MGLLAISIDEGFSGLRHPFDFRGNEPRLQPFLRVGSHVWLVAGLLMLGAWIAISAVTAAVAVVT